MMHVKKGQLVWDTLIPWIIGITFLVIATLVALGLSGKLGGLGEFIRNFLRFGR